MINYIKNKLYFFSLLFFSSSQMKDAVLPSSEGPSTVLAGLRTSVPGKKGSHYTTKTRISHSLRKGEPVVVSVSSVNTASQLHRRQPANFHKKLSPQFKTGLKHAEQHLNTLSTMTSESEEF